MKYAAVAALLLLLALAATGDEQEYGPDDAIGRLILHADSLSSGPTIDQPRSALWWILHEGNDSSFALLEETIADPGTPEGYVKWLLEQIPLHGAGRDAQVPCGTVTLLQDLLAPDRLSPPAWALCFQSLAQEVSRTPGCVGDSLLNLVEAKLAAPEFLGGFSAMAILGATAEDGCNATLRRRSRVLFWRALDRLETMTGEFAPTPQRLAYAMSAGLSELPFKHPQELDPDFMERMVRMLQRRGSNNSDCRLAAGLLLASLRERPDLRRRVPWDSLREALLGDESPSALHEGRLIAIADLLPYAPQWIDRQLVSKLLASFTPKPDSLRIPNSRSYFGGTAEALGACANFGQDPALARRIKERLAGVAFDSKQARGGREEAFGALAAMGWQHPELLDADLKRRLRRRLHDASVSELRYGPDARALELLQLSFEVRPDLIGHRDLSALIRIVEAKEPDHVFGLEDAVVSLAKAASDRLYLELETALEAHLAKVAEDINRSYDARNLLERVRCERAGVSPCE